MKREWRGRAMRVLTLLAACSLAIAAGELVNRGDGAHAAAVERYVANAVDRKALESGGHRVGASNAPVAVAVFADFECPHAADRIAQLRALRAEYGNAIAVVFHHYPSRSNPRATREAIAAECAANQGRFGEYADSLRGNNIALMTSPKGALDSLLRALASHVNVTNLSDFDHCLTHEAVEPRIDADYILARRLHVVLSPTVFVNGRRAPSTADGEVFSQFVRGSLPRDHWWQVWR